jgi:hypothetical protein
MGIDVHLKWDEQTEEEAKAQITGFSIVHGHVGYLREAYHGGPYATKVLMPEGFGHEDHNEEELEHGVRIPAATLRERLPQAIVTVALRDRKLYQSDADELERAMQSYVDFVELAEKLEAAGRNPKVWVSY